MKNQFLNLIQKIVISTHEVFNPDIPPDFKEEEKQIFKLGEEYDHQRAKEILRNFVDEFGEQVDTITRPDEYISRVLRQFEEAWVYESYYEEWVTVWKDDVAKHQRRIDEWEFRIDKEIEQHGVFWEETYRQKSLYERVVKRFKRDMERPRWLLNNASVALYLIRETRTFLLNYTHTNPTSNVSEQVESGLKLQWNGASDTLYDIFRQLKNHHLPNGSTLLEESYDHIAQFIRQSFIGFDELEASTIRGKLTKSKRPKKTFNKIDLDLTEPD